MQKLALTLLIASVEAVQNRGKFPNHMTLAQEDKAVAKTTWTKESTCGGAEVAKMPKLDADK